MKKIIFAIFFLFISANLFAEATAYVVWVDGLRVRESASPDSKVAASLKKYDEVTDLDECTDDTYTAKLAGEEFTGGWRKIKTKQNITGWCFEPALSNIFFTGNLKIYVVKNELFIIQKETDIVLNKTPLKDKRTSNKVEVLRNSDLLIIGAGWATAINRIYDIPYYVYILYNMEMNKFIGQITGYGSFAGRSGSKKYIMFDDMATGRTMIYDVSEQKTAYEFSRHSCEDWKGDTVKYTELIGPNYEGLPTLEGGRSYIRECVWKDGKITKTDKISIIEK
jgi:hypothetical protein